jgi:hypothetical protein
MDMFGGLTKTSSRIAIAAALGFTLGGIAMQATPAKAADLGGDCCADLEERVAELEATTVRKGNKKVSVTLSGWVVKSVNYWNDGDIESVYVGDKDYDLGTRFALTGGATIAPGWSAGYNITVLAPASVFGFGSNQFNENSGGFGAISTLYSYMYIKSDKWGTLNWGHLSPASDNPAVLADISGTVIESNSVWFEGPGFLLRPNGGAPGSFAGLSGLTWGNFVQCAALGAGIGTDCWGAAQPAVRYDTPTFGGFRAEISTGTNLLTGPFGAFQGTPEDKFWDAALFYNGDWGNFKVSAAYAYTWVETGVAAFAGPFGVSDSVDFHQVGATVMHVPSGLGLYAMYDHESTSVIPDTDAWYAKLFLKRNMLPLGATVFYGEYGEYDDMFGSLFGGNVCGAFAGLPGTNAGAFCGAAVGNTLFVTGSEIQRFGLGAVQEIDSAAMHIGLRWQHQEADIDFVGLNAAGAPTNVGQGFEDWDAVQFIGIMFF